MVTSQTYSGVPGDTQIFAPELAYVRILGVKREGLGYNVFFGLPPGNRQVEYDPAGFIKFDIPFTGDISDTMDILTEKVFVLWDA